MRCAVKSSHSEVVPNDIIHGPGGLLVVRKVGWIGQRVLQAAVGQIHGDVVGTNVLKSDVSTPAVAFEPAVGPALVGFLKLTRGELSVALCLRSPGLRSLLLGSVFI